MPLVMGDSGQAYEIKRIGGNDEVRTHLASMGFDSCLRQQWKCDRQC